MHKKQDLARRGLIERPGVGKATPGEVLWRTQHASPLATAMNIENQIPKPGLIVC
jgi:hypothetical protein